MIKSISLVPFNFLREEDITCNDKGFKFCKRTEVCCNYFNDDSYTCNLGINVRQSTIFKRQFYHKKGFYLDWFGDN